MITKTSASADAAGCDARTRLLSAALQVLHENGILALTQTQVAAAAGLRQSHLTYYFPTRSDLLKAIVEHASSAVLGLVGGRPEFPAKNLADLRSRLIKQGSDIRMPRLMIAMAVASDADPSLKAWMAAFELRIRKLLGSTLQRLGLKVGARELALFHATLVGVSVFNSSAGTAASARHARNLIRTAFDRLVRDTRSKTAGSGN
jgi:AcrR family transcriptional regulator